MSAANRRIICLQAPDLAIFAALDAHMGCCRILSSVSPTKNPPEPLHLYCFLKIQKATHPGSVAMRRISFSLSSITKSLWMTEPSVQYSRKSRCSLHPRVGVRTEYSLRDLAV